MTAFTHLCKKANISLHDNTITLYPKRKGTKKIGYYPEVSRASRHHAELGKKVTFIRRKDVGHDHFHQDVFDRENQHFHMQFERTIDEPDLRDILDFLLRHKVITSQEKESFLKDFNHISQQDPIEEILNLDAFTTELDHVKAKAESLEEKAKTNKDYEAAAKSASILCLELKNALEDLLQNPQTIAKIHLFKASVNASLDKASIELRHHRGWKEVFINIGLAIGLVGVGYLVWGLYNLSQSERFTIFRPNTESMNKLNDLQEATSKISFTV